METLALSHDCVGQELGRAQLAGSAALCHIRGAHLVIFSWWGDCPGGPRPLHFHVWCFRGGGTVTSTCPPHPGMAFSEGSYQLRDPRVSVHRENAEAGRALTSSLGHPKLSLCHILFANQISWTGLDSGGGGQTASQGTEEGRPHSSLTVHDSFLWAFVYGTWLISSIWPFRSRVTADGGTGQSFVAEHWQC